MGEGRNLKHFLLGLADISKNEVPVEKHGTAAEYLEAFSDFGGVEALVHGSQGLVLSGFDAQHQ